MLYLYNLPEDAIAHYVGETSVFIKEQREIFYPQAQPLDDELQEMFRPFFSDAILKSTLFYLKQDGPIQAPPFLEEMRAKGVPFPLERLQAITFIDVVVFYTPLSARVKFHEFVHAVQYQKLGYKQFTNKYVRGLLSKGTYEKIPLEYNAKVLDEAYSKSPTQPFSVEQEVQRWLNENRF